MLTDDDSIETDSAGTGGWHVGNPPDERAIEEAARRGVDLSDLRARQVTASDFDSFDLILAMDRANLSALQALAPKRSRAELRMMLSYGQGGDVPDPYYEGGFPHTFDLIEEASRGLLA
ncbi:UNVERIFIED_CONTAM: hypothetical protein GTU68_001962, partial [Idotea baltica]|nr:hypothetical protein [Idotea baltica]